MPKITKTAIIQFRKRLSWSQPQLAVFLGVHTQTVSKWERGKLAPTPYQKNLLSNLIEITQKPEYRQAIMTYSIGMLVAAGVAALTVTAQEYGKKTGKALKVTKKAS